MGQNMIRFQLDIAKQHTRNAKIIKCHSRQTRVHGTTLKPPKQNIGDLLGVCTEIAIDLVTKLRGLSWGGKKGIKHVHVLGKGSRWSRRLAQNWKALEIYKKPFDFKDLLSYHCFLYLMALYQKPCDMYGRIVYARVPPLYRSIPVPISHFWSTEACAEDVELQRHKLIFKKAIEEWRKLTHCDSIRLRVIRTRVVPVECPFCEP
jgi:hypothetical protein